jgi:hypothetical protein
MEHSLYYHAPSLQRGRLELFRVAWTFVEDAVIKDPPSAKDLHAHYFLIFAFELLNHLRHFCEGVNLKISLFRCRLDESDPSLIPLVCCQNTSDQTTVSS